MMTVKSTCCYCGTGCGVEIDVDHGQVLAVRGDPEHPANFGRLCTKGLTLAHTLHADSRLAEPRLRPGRLGPGQAVSWDVALDTVSERLAAIIAEHGPESVAFYLSGQMLTEDYYVYNKLARGLIGTPHVDTNSRLCMSSAVTGYKLALGADAPPCSYEDFDHADCVLIAGSNMAYAHPVLFRRLEAARAANPKMKLIVVDPRRTDTAASADLHLAIQPGADVALFNGMLHALIWDDRLDRDFINAHTEGFAELRHAVREYTPKMAADICGISEEALLTAARWFGEAGAVLSLWCMGLNQSAHGSDKNLALINLHLATGQIGRPGAGPFSLTGQPNAMGGREVGGLATALSGHRDPANPQHRAEVAAIWGVDALPATPGKTAIPMFDAIAAGQIKALWIVCTNPAHSMPDANKVREALAACELVIVQDAYADTDSVAYADVLLPAAGWAEKDGTVTNSERRISRVRRAVAAPGSARADWDIGIDAARRLAARLGRGAHLFPYAGPDEVFAEHCLTTVGRDLDIGGLSYAVLEAEGPQQWPRPAGASQGAARLYTDHHFATDNGRARFHVARHHGVASPISARYPFHLLTGRLRDQWHGMSRSGRVPALFAHTQEAALSMNPGDMARRGLTDGELVRVSNSHGDWVLPVSSNDAMLSGQLFVPMHWSSAFVGSAGSNALTAAKIDRKSFQPELKHVAVRVDKIDLAWQCAAVSACGDPVRALSALRPLLAECRFASATLLDGERPAVRVRFAHEALPAADFLARLDAALGLEGEGLAQVFADPRRGIDKRAIWQDGCLRAVRLAGECCALGWLGERIVSGGELGELRAMVFAPQANPPGLTRRARMVCHCAKVDEAAIYQALAGGASPDSLRDTLGCGSGCGSCMPEVRRMAASVTKAA
ncbi:nitrate reductase [Rivihabitans pingtungensis]|uniref:Assimilatory nitrate reductase catalytic subunit n=1 Tax=Rivihabitans pingtungensis TaxID=1054498 RepID=A0A318KGU2_9NEIS|nr:nitrate reductase [Rivihabitans pingtungensis]PXX77041.1 assimilatory nitrate reductase catalytic subunit [Rivihabitans pingtungensis]